MIAGSVLDQSAKESDKMKILYTSKYIYKVMRLIILVNVLTYFLGLFWYFFTKRDFF